MATSSECIASFEADKDLLLTRVSELVFVNGEVGLRCGRCNRVPIRHYTANCGHRFCANCRSILTVSKEKCPLWSCEKPVESIDFQDVEFERKLYDLKTYCPNKNYGCPFVSQLQDLGGHLRMCMRDTMDTVRPVLSETEAKLEVRKKRNTFLTQFKNKSTELASLEKQGFDLERFIELRLAQMNIFTLLEGECSLNPDFTWTIYGVKDIIHQDGLEMQSEAFGWTDYPVRARAKMKVEGWSGVEMSLCLGEQDEDLKLNPNVYYLIRFRNELNIPIRKCDTAFDYDPLTFKVGFSFQSESNYPGFSKGDSFVIDVYVEPPTMAREVYSYDGTLYWAIDNYAKNTQMAENSEFHYHGSCYFYTGPKGYRVQVKMWMGRSLTACICFLPGEFDADLPTTFPHKITFTLFSQNTTQPNIEKTVRYNFNRNDNPCMYYIDVCDEDEIENEIENYILNDTLFYKVTVKPIKLNSCIML